MDHLWGREYPTTECTEVTENDEIVEDFFVTTQSAKEMAAL